MFGPLSKTDKRSIVVGVTQLRQCRRALLTDDCRIRSNIRMRAGLRQPIKTTARDVRPTSQPALQPPTITIRAGRARAGYLPSL